MITIRSDLHFQQGENMINSNKPFIFSNNSKKSFAILALSFLPFCGIANAATYKIDSSHSAVNFKVKHLGISNVSGKFGDFSGTFDFSEKEISESKTNAIIKITSVDTGIKQRDDHLKGADFFEADKFPEITFTSKSVKSTGNNTFDVLGNLSLHGVSKPATLKVTYDGSEKDPWGNQRAAFTGTTKINRKDFGLSWNKTLDSGNLLVGEDINITLEIEGILEK
jgi:polyisoprenoid-binding protein YceI